MENSAKVRKMAIIQDADSQNIVQNTESDKSIGVPQQQESPIAPKPEQAPSTKPVEAEDKGTSEVQPASVVAISMSDRQSNVGANNIKETVRADAIKLNDKLVAFKKVAKRVEELGKVIAELGRVEKKRFNTLANDRTASASEDKTEKAPTLEDKANPTALSDNFCRKCEEGGLGLETKAWTDENNNVNFNITEVQKDRADLADFLGYTVSISGLANNEALIDFVSAVRVAGFEKAIEYMNSDVVKEQYKKQYNLSNIETIELTLFDKNGKKIEDEKTLNNFKKLTVTRDQLENTMDGTDRKPESDSDIENSNSASQSDSERLSDVSGAEQELRERVQDEQNMVVGSK